MGDFIRDTALGYCIRFLSGNRVLQYPEDCPGFEVPAPYRLHPTIIEPEHAGVPTRERRRRPQSDASFSSVDAKEQSVSPSSRSVTPNVDIEKDLEESEGGIEKSRPNSILPEAPAIKDDFPHELPHQFRKDDLERASTKDVPMSPIVPKVTSDGIILVDFYTNTDPDNPQNWSYLKKNLTALQICLYTFAVYMGSAIYTPSENGVIEAFGVSPTVASLGLALYVLGYGIGPLFFSPLSEIPIVGRNPPYIITFGIFVILCVPTALVDNLAGLLVLRFLQGFFGSPALATGGASFGDLYNIVFLPVLMTFWVAAATCGPALGPIVSGFSVAAENWHWSLWEMLWLSGPIFIILFLFLPETSPNNILLRKAQRLRKLTGNDRLKSQSEIDQAKLTPRAILIDALWKPLELHFLDPSIAFATVYTALMYGIYYSFFEAFPIVYVEKYGFNLGELGLTFLSIAVAVILAVPCYIAYILLVTTPPIVKTGQLGPPEERLVPALFAAFFLPIGLFLFGWTANGHIHWIASVIGITIYTFGIFIIIQCIFIYLPLSYPQYAASLYAGNDLARSCLACGAILFARPLFDNLGIGKGISILACLTALFGGGLFVLWYFGAKLRARSRFTVKTPPPPPPQ